MPTLYTTIGPVTLQTFTLFVALAILVSAGVGMLRARLASGESVIRSYQPSAVADAYLGALLGGVALARLGHVILAWDYFGDNLGEIVRLELGGLNWHGAVLGGILGLLLAARWRKVSFRDLLDTLTLALPLIGLAGWWGCLASACGYGAEVDTLANYPAYAVSESADIFGIVLPRYNTQWFGLVLAAALLALALLLVAAGRLRYRRFWFILALLSAGMFVIGFLRGDYVTMIGGLRLDQWFDLGLAALGVWQLVMRVRLWES